jgi:ferrous iron transport protein A
MSNNSDHGHAFSLSSAKQGDFVRVIDVKADNLLKKRLVSMGVLMNSRLRIIQRRGNALVVGFDASRIAIGSGMSQHIMVKAV